MDRRFFLVPLNSWQSWYDPLIWWSYSKWFQCSAKVTILQIICIWVRQRQRRNVRVRWWMCSRMRQWDIHPLIIESRFVVEIRRLGISFGLESWCLLEFIGSDYYAIGQYILFRQRVGIDWWWQITYASLLCGDIWCRWLITIHCARRIFISNKVMVELYQQLACSTAVVGLQRDVGLVCTTTSLAQHREYLMSTSIWQQQTSNANKGRLERQGHRG